jgi:8-oxo-dGTP pyrophosphatase MutT (NUDIX family)
MVVRDAPDLEVLVLRRTAAAVFGPGATVFPGGAVDDGDEALGSRVVGAETGQSVRFRVAAVRECFEEAGLLLAHSTNGAPVIPKPEWRDACNAGHATFAQMLDAEDLVVDVRDLVVFAHWLTPIGAPRRYDTWFFLARAPQGQVAAHDDNEAVASGWVRPEDALHAYASGEIDLIFPTLRSMEALAQFRTTSSLFAAVASAPRGENGHTLVVGEGSGERVALPIDVKGRELRDAWTIPLPDLHVDDETRMLAERMRS